MISQRKKWKEKRLVSGKKEAQEATRPNGLSVIDLESLVGEALLSNNQFMTLDIIREICGRER